MIKRVSMASPLRIENSDVATNIREFTDVVRLTLIKGETETKREYPIYIHRKTGILRFSFEGPLNYSEWMPGILSVNVLNHEADILNEKKRPINMDGFPKGTKRILIETLRILTDLSHEVKKIAEFATLTLLFSLDNNEFIKMAWHPFNREEAEAYLKDKPPGSYVFRKDPFAEILEKELGQAYHRSIKCVTLSYNDETGQARDLTLVNRNYEWLVYNDNPELLGEPWASLQDLIKATI